MKGIILAAFALLTVQLSAQITIFEPDSVRIRELVNDEFVDLDSSGIFYTYFILDEENDVFYFKKWENNHIFRIVNTVRDEKDSIPWIAEYDCIDEEGNELGILVFGFDEYRKVLVMTVGQTAFFYDIHF